MALSTGEHCNGRKRRGIVDGSQFTVLHIFESGPTKQFI